TTYACSSLLFALYFVDLACLLSLIFFFSLYFDHLSLHSFPTRRSSDLLSLSLSLSFSLSFSLFLSLSLSLFLFLSLSFSLFLSRSEEHTSELQSPYDLVCRLLLEKKKILLSYLLYILITLLISTLHLLY